MSSSGVNYMFNKFTAGTPGADAKKDEINELGLSRLGGYCLSLFKYDKAMSIFQTALARYPQGKNALFIKYRMARCAEKLKDYSQAVDLLKELMDANAHATDDRVPNNDNLDLRAEKLIEMHELEKR
jgi:tetratricopeptide (TPR) repeat protein